MKNIKNEDIVFTGGLFLFGFLSIILKKLYLIKGFISYISGIFIIAYLAKICKILTDDEKLDQLTNQVFGDEENEKQEKKQEKIFGFDMRIQD